MWAMKARDQFHKEQQRPCRNVTIDEQITASVEGQQNSSTSLRPRTALRRGANVLPMQDGGVRLALLGRPQRVIMGTVSCSNNTPKKCQKKKKKSTAASTGLIQLQMGGINLSSASSTETMEEDPSGSAEAGSSATVRCVACFQWFATRVRMCHYTHVHVR